MTLSLSLSLLKKKKKKEKETVTPAFQPLASANPKPLTSLMAESSTQSNSKRQTLSPGKDAVVDRISSLPESLLCHILSFLPTKELIATSILSTRWKLLWTLVPKLDLDSDKINTLELSLHDDDVEDAREIMFAHVVSSVLAQQECGELQTFRLRWEIWSDGSHLDAWLGTAAARKVKELDLEILMYDSDVGNLKLPPSFFSCRTLVVLKLSGDIDIDIDIDTPSLSFNFPSLKILHLVEISLPMPSIMYSQEHSFLRLLSGCPVLEDLSFTTTDFSEGEYKLCVPTLKRLSFGETDFNYSDYELEINAPALEYFEFYGDLRAIKFYEKLDNVVQSDVYISRYVPEGFRRKWVFNLFAALNNVKFLSFSPRGTEWHNLGNIYPSSFQNLVELKFKVNGCSWNVLQDLLQKAPNLETLVITNGYDSVESNLYWKEPQYDPANLSSLTSFYYRGFKGLKDEVELVKYVLKEARVLKTATFQVSSGESKESVLEKLSMFPRCSTTCLLRVE
ncbi:putative FBD-associated F-box protein At3g50710 [Quercus robur]|uniref:putative FBD-associated F-box protein At3g50710 n=1 Tax=Quercus robur TaxID=38942 RepID=UPI002162961A|nr:putative FBD-associated F-box protein At3g50710 [Quercus robur]XP_050247517.1 putative FBD-associated F-box protein At3g50710 [Quercus robur]XP_050247519.1 putative FBD-associated F-box protein At3g50710 [Quercus robur]XP_050247520.1 putative FBD-associated F-box protein At3g50710 [Quercus robur]XP_050247521.1 putative FBD-associated F-box protein At3g50710 [Quercus robur]XP_050247522.1 putative FBD-associated F-box protein At3g50710 [Quercus robur]XP_050247523.1 putative FBD-associated F-